MSDANDRSTPCCQVQSRRLSRNTRSWICVGFVFSALVTLIAAGRFYAQTPPAASVPPAPDEHLTGEAKAGEDLFNAHCIVCHQPGGKGQVGLAPSLRNPDFLALGSDDYIRNTVKHGRMGTPMVARPDLSDKQVGSIIAYLRSLHVELPRTVKVDWEKKFNGDREEGRVKYTVYCAACHGPNGEGYAAGVVGSAIGMPGFLKVASDDYILQTTKLGRIGTPMQPFVGSRGLANLSEGDIHDIIAHLRHLGANYRPPRVAALRPGIPAEGEKIFVVNCAPCHQIGGAGKIGFAPSIRNRDFLALASDDLIRRSIKEGRAGTAMLARPDLSSQQVTDIIAYLRALPNPLPVEITVDPRKKFEGDALAGATQYGTFCAACHGPNGEGYVLGLPGTSIGLAGFLDAASDDYIYQTLRHGRVGTPMKSFIGARGVANLTEKDAHDIIAHLRTIPEKMAKAKPAESNEFE